MSNIAEENAPMPQRISKALIVDDSRLARIALSKLLGKRQIDVDVVGTGTEALEYLSDRQPDIVFMDYMMPDMDGFEATRGIQASLGISCPPVVMYTSQDSDQDRQTAQKLGIAGFLSKPSGEQSLDELLSQLAERQPATEEPTTSPMPGEGREASPEHGDESREPFATAHQTAESPLGSTDTTEVSYGQPLADAPIPEDEDQRAPAAMGGDSEHSAATATTGASAPEPEGPATTADSPKGATATLSAGAPTTEPDWQTIRDTAAQAAREASHAVLENALPRALAPLRQELEDARNRTLDEAQRIANEAVSANAEQGAREAAAAVAETTSRSIANSVAEETAQQVAESLGPETSRRVMAELREELQGYVAEAMSAARGELDEQTLAALRERTAEAVDAAVEPAVEERLAAFRIERERAVADAIARERSATRALAWGLGAAALAVATVALAVSLIVALGG